MTLLDTCFADIFSQFVAYLFILLVVSFDEQKFFILFYYFCFLGLHFWHMEFPRLGIKLEQQLLAYATVTATSDLSCVFDLLHSSQQHQILDPLSEGRN